MREPIFLGIYGICHSNEIWAVSTILAKGDEGGLKG